MAVIGQKLLTRRKTGGSLSEAIDIAIPLNTSAINWAIGQQGSNNSLANTFAGRVILTDGVITFAGLAGTAILNNLNNVLTQGRSTDVNGTHLRWTIQASTLFTNEFYLKLTFLNS